MKHFLSSRSIVWLKSKDMIKWISRDMAFPCNKGIKSMQCTAISSYPVTSLDNNFKA